MQHLGEMIRFTQLSDLFADLFQLQWDGLIVYSPGTDALSAPAFVVEDGHILSADGREYFFSPDGKEHELLLSIGDAQDLYAELYPKMAGRENLLDILLAELKAHSRIGLI